MSTSSPDTHLIPRPNRWAVLALLGVAQLMVVLDATIVNIALPSAQRALHFTADNRQWVITAYALAFGSLLLLGGKLGDLFGRKWTLIGGLVGFAGASAIGGMAQSFGMLVAARALQGAFGAILAPSALGCIAIRSKSWSRSSPPDHTARSSTFRRQSPKTASSSSSGFMPPLLRTETANLPLHPGPVSRRDSGLRWWVSAKDRTQAGSVRVVP